MAGISVEYLHQPQVCEVTLQCGGWPEAILEERGDRKLHRDSAGVTNPIAHATRELQMVPVTGHQVAAGLGNTDDRLARAQLLRRNPVVHEALEVDRGLVHALGIVEPVARAEPARGPGGISSHG